MDGGAVEVRLIDDEHSCGPSTATHPGEILLEDFLRPLGVTQVQLAAHPGVSLQRVNEIALRR